MNNVFIMAAAVFAITIWRPRYGLSATILLWPAYLMRTTVLNVPTTALELSLYAVAAAVIIQRLAKKISWHWIRMNRWTWWLLAAWVGAWTIATVAAPDRVAALGASKAWLVDPLLFSALLVFIVRSENDRRLIIQAVTVSGLGVALFGLYQIWWWPQTLQEGRLSSFFHPVANYAAMYLEPIFVLTAGLLLFRYWRGVWWWFCAGVMLLAIILTRSYGGFLAVAVGVTLLWRYLPSGRLKKWLAIGSATAGLATLLLLINAPSFTQHFRLADRSSGLVRKEIWVTSWALIRQNPLVGIGPNNFEAAYQAEVPKHYFPPLEWLVAKPHNLYLALWLELGLLGLLAFMAPLIRHIRLLRKHFILMPEEKAVAVASLAALVAILVHGLVDTPYFKNDLAMEYMLVALLPWLGEKKSRF